MIYYRAFTAILRSNAILVIMRPRYIDVSTRIGVRPLGYCETPQQSLRTSEVFCLSYSGLASAAASCDHLSILLILGITSKWFITSGIMLRHTVLSKNKMNAVLRALQIILIDQ